MITISRRLALLSFLILNSTFLLGGNPATLTFDLDGCRSFLEDGSFVDYSEFTADIENTDQINLSVVGGNLFRNNPLLNRHSCTPGFDNAPAMCVSYDNSSCSYDPGNETAVRFNILVSPVAGATATLSNLDFYEFAPRAFDWIGGASGPNDPPTLMAIRVLVDGVVVFESSELPTSEAWTERSFDFSNIPAFTVTDDTEFSFEISAYCPLGLSATQHIWDLDNIRLTAVCSDADVPNDDMGVDSMTMGMDTMTVGVDTMMMNVDTMTMGVDTMTSWSLYQHPSSSYQHSSSSCQHPPSSYPCP